MRTKPAISGITNITSTAATLLLCGALSATGCHAPREPSAQHTTAPSQRPPDFALGLTVFPTASDAAAPAGSDADHSSDGPSGHTSGGERYLVEADGLLRAEFGGGVAPTRFPPRVRRLTLAEYDELYRVALESGLLDLPPTADPEAPEPSPATFRPPVGAPAALAFVTTGGDKRTLAFDLDEQGPRSAALQPVLEWWRERTWRRQASGQSPLSSGN